MGRHTEALKYTLLERLIFRVFGYWPVPAVDKRMKALFEDEDEAREQFLRELR